MIWVTGENYNWVISTDMQEHKAYMRVFNAFYSFYVVFIKWYNRASPDHFALDYNLSGSHETCQG